MDENIIEETTDNFYDEFMSEFMGDDYQNDTSDEDVQDHTDDSEEESDEDDTSEDQSGESEYTDESTEEDSEPEEGKEQPEEEEVFTIKVNKEERQVSREEMTALAQKGADYDRVKGQLKDSQAENQRIQGQLDELSKYGNAIEMLRYVSEQSEIPVESIVEQVRVSLKMKSGKSEAESRAEIAAEDAQRRADSLEKKLNERNGPTESERLSRLKKEVQEFEDLYPDVELTEELCAQLNDDVQGGMSLANAYQKYESKNALAAKDQRIKELELQLKGEKKNKRNRHSSPGSMQDSGGSNAKTGFNVFMSEFGK